LGHSFRRDIDLGAIGRDVIVAKES
jgi:hypothetical protein